MKLRYWAWVGLVVACGGGEQGAAIASAGQSQGGGGGAEAVLAAGSGGVMAVAAAGAAVQNGGSPALNEGGAPMVAGAGGVGGAPVLPDPTVPLPVPATAGYLELLYGYVDALIATQITDPGDPNFGALVSPETNPQVNPIFSRAAEAVYPIAVAFKHSQKAEYKAAALSLGTWLTNIQQPSGAWGEEPPNHDGWNGTTADQLVSLAGAYGLLTAELPAPTAAAWAASIRSAAGFVEGNFPGGNVNYSPTRAVGLVLAARSVPDPDPAWLPAAENLMQTTLAAIEDDGFLHGEGGGVDPGYNLAQSIGYIALYGVLLESEDYKAAAATLLTRHASLMYPNGAIDNSWGTRNYKWMLESGTKTAPGVPFSFALLADRDPAFARGLQLSLDFLGHHATGADGFIFYGPHAHLHPTSTPPSNYSTCSRAQSLAMAVEYAKPIASVGMIPADTYPWLEHFTSVDVAVARTASIMATVSAYAANATYPGASVLRGGSTSALWFAGYGDTGFMQVSSQTNYQRIEGIHMPNEGELLPLTPRIETNVGVYRSNLFDDSGSLVTSENAEGVEIVSSGVLREAGGASANVEFSWAHSFAAESFAKTVTLTPNGVALNTLQIVEPFVDNAGNEYALTAPNKFQITSAAGVWQLEVTASSGEYELTAGDLREQYWSPFPGLNAYPLTIKITAAGDGAYTISYQVTRLE